MPSGPIRRPSFTAPMLLERDRTSRTLNDGRGGKGVTYAARLRVIAKGGSVKADGNGLRVTGADEVMLLVAAVILVNLLVDLSYALVDPRLRHRR